MTVDFPLYVFHHGKNFKAYDFFGAHPYKEGGKRGYLNEDYRLFHLRDELAQEVQFFSLGTNDLTQYTLAIDRQNPKLDAFYNPHHPAILRMIRHTIEAGHRHGCWVGICGELGADPALTETFLRMGIDELSVSPAAILPLRKRIRELDLSRPAASEPLDGA